MSTNEAYTVAANLMMKSNVGETLPGIIANMERLNTILNTSREELGKLSGSFDKMARVAVTAAERAARAQTEGAERGARAQITASERAARAEEISVARAERAELRKTEARERASRRQADAQFRLDRSEAEYENRQRDRAARLAAQGAARQARGSHVGAMEVQMAASSAEGTLSHLITSAAHAAMDPAQTENMLAQDDRVGAKGAREGRDAAWAATQSAPGTTLAKNMEALLDLKSVTGDYNEAKEILPQFAKLSAVLAATDRQHGGAGDPAFAAAKAMEILGLMTTQVRNPETGRIESKIDPKLIQPHIEAMARVAMATNGRVSPEMYLAFAKQARVGGMNLSTEFLEQKLPAMLLAMGGDRAGTAIQSMSQVFQGGRLTDKSLAMMQELGLGGDAHTVGKGSKKHVEGQVYEQALLGTDPAEWAKKVHDHLVNDLKMTETEAMNSVQKMSQRNTIAGFIADLMKDAASIAKEQENIRHTAQNPGDFDKFLASNPAAQVNQFHASLENLMAAFGGPAMQPAIMIMNAMTASLNKFSDWANKNPIKAEIIDVAIAAGAAIAGALAAISGAMMIYGPIIAAGRALALGAPAAAAGGAGGGAAAAEIAAGAGGLALAPVVLGTAAIGGSIYLGSKYQTPETEAAQAALAKARRFDPMASPSDGYDVEGKSIAPKPSDLAPHGNTGGTQDVRVVNPGDLARASVGNLARQGNRPDVGASGFDTKGSIQPSVNLGLR